MKIERQSEEVANYIKQVKKKTGRPKKYNFGILEVGDAFIEDEIYDAVKQRSKIDCAARQYKKRLFDSTGQHVKFIVFIMNNVIYCARIE